MNEKAKELLKVFEELSRQECKKVYALGGFDVIGLDKVREELNNANVEDLQFTGLQRSFRHADNYGTDEYNANGGFDIVSGDGLDVEIEKGVYIGENDVIIPLMWGSGYSSSYSRFDLYLNLIFKSVYEIDEDGDIIDTIERIAVVDYFSIKDNRK